MDRRNRRDALAAPLAPSRSPAGADGRRFPVVTRWALLRLAGLAAVVAVVEWLR
jgi:hypothetical protein